MLHSHQNPSRKLDIFEYRTYSDPKLCVLECVKECIHRRSDRVDKDQKRLFVTYRKPYHAASIDTHLTAHVFPGYLFCFSTSQNHS